MMRMILRPYCEVCIWKNVDGREGMTERVQVSGKVRV